MNNAVAARRLAVEAEQVAATAAETARMRTLGRGEDSDHGRLRDRLTGSSPPT